MVQRILIRSSVAPRLRVLSRPLRSRQQERAKERLESELWKALQASDTQSSSNTWPVKSHVATSDIGIQDSFTQKVLTRYGYLLAAPQFRILQNASEQRLTK